MEIGNKIDITINVADERLKMKIRPEDEEQIRDAEQNVNGLFKQWCERFPTLTHTRVLAMVAFQYASLYYNKLSEQRQNDYDLREMLADYEKQLDELVVKI